MNETFRLMQTCDVQKLPVWVSGVVWNEDQSRFWC